MELFFRLSFSCLWFRKPTGTKRQEIFFSLLIIIFFFFSFFYFLFFPFSVEDFQYFEFEFEFQVEGTLERMKKWSGQEQNSFMMT